MFDYRRCYVALGGALLLGTAIPGGYAQAAPIRTVFVIAMENHNWSQPDHQFTGTQQQVYHNPAAPFLSSLVDGASSISRQVAYASNYHNVLATPTGIGASNIHPSEPNYIWAEAGSNLGVLNDNPPYGTGGTNQNTAAHLSTLLTKSGQTWKSYQEDIDLLPNSGSVNIPGPDSLTSTVAPQSQWTVPLSSFSGSSASYTNPYNGAHQYEYAAKHNPMLFFSDTNGGNNGTNTNPLASKYAPLQQLQIDLEKNTVAKYNWITPNQFNDMHTALSGGFTYNGRHYTGDQAQIAQGDNFLSKIIPAIMASQAYKNNGAIILWWDETAPTGTGNENDFNHTIGEIVISPAAHPNVKGKPYVSTLNYSHSDDLRTMQDIFHVRGKGYLGDAANAQGLNDLFAAGAVDSVP